MKPIVCVLVAMVSLVVFGMVQANQPQQQPPVTQQAPVEKAPAASAPTKVTQTPQGTVECKNGQCRLLRQQSSVAGVGRIFGRRSGGSCSRASLGSSGGCSATVQRGNCGCGCTDCTGQPGCPCGCSTCPCNDNAQTGKVSQTSRVSRQRNLRSGSLFRRAGKCRRCSG